MKIFFLYLKMEFRICNGIKCKGIKRQYPDEFISNKHKNLICKYCYKCREYERNKIGDLAKLNLYKKKYRLNKIEKELFFNSFYDFMKEHSTVEEINLINNTINENKKDLFLIKFYNIINESSSEIDNINNILFDKLNNENIHINKKKIDRYIKERIKK